MKKLLMILSVCLVSLLAGACGHAAPEAESAPAVPKGGAVVLDIGHHVGAGGASSPDGKVSEFNFWCQYAGDIKAAVEAAGYPCVIINRGKPVQREPMANACKKADVQWLKYPERGGHRYPSRYYPDCIGAGMVSADFAIEQKAVCAVFLHLNSVGSLWSTKPPTGLIICNRHNGRPLADAVCSTMLEKLCDKPGGMPNAGKGCKVIVRDKKEQMSAGWLNACDAAGIPAIVIENVYVNNRGHVDFIKTEAGARKLAATIAEGIISWLETRK